MPRPLERDDRPVRTLVVLRLIAGLSQKKLASELEILQVKLSHYEHGLDLTHEHGEILLAFFQKNSRTSTIAKKLSYDDLTAFWPVEEHTDEKPIEAEVEGV